MGLKERLRKIEDRVGNKATEEVLFVECVASYDRVSQTTYNEHNFEIHKGGKVTRFNTYDEVEDYIHELEALSGKKYKVIIVCKVYPGGEEYAEEED